MSVNTTARSSTSCVCTNTAYIFFQKYKKKKKEENCRSINRLSSVAVNLVKISQIILGVCLPALQNIQKDFFFFFVKNRFLPVGLFYREVVKRTNVHELCSALWSYCYLYSSCFCLSDLESDPYFLRAERFILWCILLFA